MAKTAARSPSLPRSQSIDRDHPDAKLYEFDDESLRSAHIARLHASLREHCEMMGVGDGKKKDGAVGGCPRMPDAVLF
jgi:hypothetical protein